MAELKRVLLIEDDSTLRMLIRAQLARLEISVVEAENGHEGLQLILTARPDLVICDYEMPRMNGLEMLKTLRERQINVPPMIWVTGRQTPRLHEEAYALGVFEFLPKPFKSADLFKHVQRLLGMVNGGGGSGALTEDFKKNFLTKTLYAETPFYLSPDLYRKLVELSESEGISASSLLDRILREHLTKDQAA